MPDSFPHFQAAYTAQLGRAYDSPEFRNAPRGFASREHIGVSFRITDPVQRHVCLPSRRTNIIFNFAEALWYLSGSRELSFIGYYAPSIAKYSQDAITLTGTAYGPRIFALGPDRVNQWDSVVRTLSEDPDSKRAILQIFQAHELLDAGNIDVACTLALQFLIRDNALHAVGFMRANDAFRGIVSDVFSFTFLLEVMATQLGLRVGTYTHQVGSLHLYEPDAKWAGRVLAEAATGVAEPTPFPRMPATDNWPQVREVLRLEELLRTDRLQLGASMIDALDLPEYWRAVVGLLEVQRQRSHGTACDSNVLFALPPVFRDLVCNKWPELTAPAPAVSVYTGGS